jgi:O-antigen ligase
MLLLLLLLLLLLFCCCCRRRRRRRRRPFLPGTSLEPAVNLTAQASSFTQLIIIIIVIIIILFNVRHFGKIERAAK